MKFLMVRLRMNINLIMVFYLVLSGLQNASAVVMRDDVESSKYLTDKVPAFVVDLPHEGHGVLFHPKWIITVAHTVFYDYAGKSIEIGDQQYTIEKTVIHPNYKNPQDHLFIGDAKPLMKHLATQDDLALIKLAEPVSGNIKSIKLNTEFNESGKIVTVFGRGAVGNGKTGENPETKQKKVLNHFQNEIEETHKQWLVYTYDASPNGLSLEGMHGSGDSGGPAVITQNGQQLLIGLSSWQHRESDLANFKGGLYGTQAYLVRISYYIGWIQSVLKAE